MVGKVVRMTTHQPRRPTWQCGRCGQPWPCSPARVELSEAYDGDRVGMAVYMAIQLYEAAAEAASVTSEDLYERFVAWTRPGNAAVVLATWAHGRPAVKRNYGRRRI